MTERFLSRCGLPKRPSTTVISGITNDMKNCPVEVTLVLQSSNNDYSVEVEILEN